jgi:peroxiredoxin
MATEHIPTPSLQEQLDSLQAQDATETALELEARMQRDLEVLSRSGITQHSLQVGEQAPGFTLPDALGQPVTLSEFLKQGPVVVTFYRGEWCPNCDLQLRAYQRILPQIQALGATLVALSPQMPDHSLSTAEKKALSFPVLSDVGNTVARQYGLVFTVPENTRTIYQQQFGIDLSIFNGDASWELPIPGTFLLDGQGMVRLAFVDVDYKHRLEPSTLLAGLRALPARNKD